MVEKVFGANRKQHFTNLQVFAAEYLELVNSACKAMVREADKLNTPNVYRLLELTMETLPTTYGHVNHVSDLIFESRMLLKQHPTSPTRLRVSTGYKYF